MENHLAKPILIGTVISAASLFLGFSVFQSIMWAVWGAPVQVQQYIALFGCLALLFCGLLWASTGRMVWRKATAVSLVTIGTVFIPASIVLVPAHNIIVSPRASFMIVTYFLTLGLVSFLPRRPVWGVAIFVGAFLASLGFAGATYYQRRQDGEYVRPAFAFYKLSPGKAGLIVDSRGAEWFSSSVREELKNAGVTGSLMWSGEGDSSNDFRVIVICAGKPLSSQKLFYPRSGTVTYLFDGSEWKRIPALAKTFDSFATLETVGNQSMLYQKLATGGIQGISAFLW